jgi:sulfatase maturation enzyme AslB (radical SAM superfamily)
MEGKMRNTRRPAARRRIIPHQKAVLRLARITWNYWIRKRITVPYKPYRLWIEPTNRCNLACVMCPNSRFKKEDLGFMDYGLYQSVIDQAAPFVHDVNLHHRGESTLHPRLADMIGYANGKGMKVKLHTNGTTLNDDLARALIQSGLRLISFSFDGYEAGTYESIRLRAKFMPTLGKIRRFLELKRELGSSTPRTVVEVIELPEKQADAGAKRKFETLLKAGGLDRLIIKKPHNWAGSVGLDTVETQSFSPCTFPWHALVVLWDGRVGSCPHDFFAEIVYGNAADTPLADLFNGPRIRKLRSQMLGKTLNTLDSPCDTCDSVRRKKISGIPLSSLKYLRD